MKLAVAYTVFALLSTIANIVAQDLTTHLYRGPFDLLASMIVGTGVGLVLKYVLDKRYIFNFQAHSIVHDGQTFTLYTLMGVVTTAIFWAFEFGFDHLFATKAMRYTGAILGLSLGYLAKYRLDKRYVFRVEQP